VLKIPLKNNLVEILIPGIQDKHVFRKVNIINYYFTGELVSSSLPTQNSNRAVEGDI
jgi:hypothetical protein